MKQEMYINRKKILTNEEHTLPPKRITKVFAQDTWLTTDEEGHRIGEGRTPSGFIQPERGGGIDQITITSSSFKKNYFITGLRSSLITTKV